MDGTKLYRNWMQSCVFSSRMEEGASGFKALIDQLTLLTGSREFNESL
jgi:hypothetical protein